MRLPGGDPLRLSVESSVIFEPDCRVTGMYLITNI